ncbi:MAG: hypothetical protein L0G27_11605, partial [Paracoccus sp. (in: a-proteobacteria)]|nr:hypothetical protein [Paracoccus sp. (in: a-proteobacteria)]
VAAAPAMNLTEALQKATAGAGVAKATVLASSQRPKARPGSQNQAIEQAVANAVASDEQVPAASASLAAPVLAVSPRPVRSPRRNSASTAAVAAPEPVAAPAPVQEASAGDMLLDSSHAPKPRSETVILAAMGEGDRTPTEELEVVRRPADSGRNWGVSLGLYRSKVEAERILVGMALQDGSTFGGASRHVANTNRGFEPKFGNLSKGLAQLACERLTSQSQECTVIAN